MYSDLIVEKLCSNILNTRFENINEKTVEHAKNRVIDTIGCIIGGANAPGNSGLIRLIRELGGRQEASILVHGGKVPAMNAALVNAVMARSYDFEPVEPMVAGKSTPGHISGTTIPTALSLGEQMGVDGKEMLTALIVGDDIASRLHVACSMEFSLQGWDGIGVMNPFGSVAIAGRLLGLNEKQLKNAFSIILHQLAGSFQHLLDFTIAFKLVQGLAARNGIFSALLAKEGWAGADDPLTGKFGFFNLYSKGVFDSKILLYNLGKDYYSDFGFKLYPCCFLLHPAVECALTLARENNIRPDDIEEVVVYLPSGVAEAFQTKPFKIGNYPQVNAAFSFRYVVATALIRKSLGLQHFLEESIRNPEILAFTNKIRFIGATNMKRMLSAKLEVKMKNGRILSKFTDAHRGSPWNPPSKEELINKYWQNIRFSKTISEGQAKELLSNLERLEECTDIRNIIKLCIAH